jgi:transposase InsO family protein
MSEQDQRDDRDRWARLRFAIIGPLLAAPPPRGELRAALERLTHTSWQHPNSGEPVRFAYATIERWFYQARRAQQDPVAALRQRIRSDAGQQRSLSIPLREALNQQYREHPTWSVQLHYDNLEVRVAADSALAPLPSYTTVARYMRRHAMSRRRRKPARRRGEIEAERQREQREVRSFEVAHTHALWHADYHHGSLRVLTANGHWQTPRLLGFIDDHSRIACHLQWYLHESAQTFVHGLSQALQKRGLPRALMTDNGSPMMAAEVKRGLHELGILHEPTLPYSPHQNAKIETFWALVESRLMAMLEGTENLTLAQLNKLTAAWVELEYQRRVHRELGTTPLERFLESPNVGRECPSSEALRQAFRAEVVRKQRRSDGTLTVLGVRFEVPAQYRHLQQAHVRYARWDLSTIDLVDARSGARLCALYPLDKGEHAVAERRRLVPAAEEVAASHEMAPLLKKLLADFAATGLPPAFLSTDEDPDR